MVIEEKENNNFTNISLNICNAIEYKSFKVIITTETTYKELFLTLRKLRILPYNKISIKNVCLYCNGVLVADSSNKGEFDSKYIYDGAELFLVYEEDPFYKDFSTKTYLYGCPNSKRFLKEGL